MNIKLDTIFRTFCESLHKREELMTEDNIRYYWFASMLKEDPELEHYTMEYPYDPKVFGNVEPPTKKELDFMYLNQNESYCMEIKFHRNPDPNTTFPHTDAAGDLFNDIRRLAIFRPNSNLSLPKNTRRLFLFVTDSEMHDYLMAKNVSQNIEYRAALRHFYNEMPINGTFEHLNINNAPKTFIKSALDTDSINDSMNSVNDIPNLRLVCSMNDIIIKSDSFLEHKCYVRLYEIQSKY